MPDTWRDIARRKQEERNRRIPAEWALQTSGSGPNVRNVPRACGILTDHEINITEHYDATGLLKELAAGKFKSEHVVRAFCKRAAIGA